MIETLPSRAAIPICAAVFLWAGPSRAGAPGALPGHSTEETARLAAEVRGMGWIVFSARTERGDWDLFLCRPDGSGRRNITATPDHNEAAPQFSRDGRRLFYRRLPRSESIDGNAYGTQGALVVSSSDGAGAKALGAEGEYPWASWSPDGRQIASLSLQGISFIDLEGGKTLRVLPRKGFFQQLTWSPDGKWLCGVANSFGTGWSVARMDVGTGEVNAVSRVNCCTPDWFPDSKRIVFSWRPPGQKGNDGYGWTQLWMADAEGKERKLVYGEDGRHVYGGHASPDGRYVLFSGNLQENGDPGRAGAPLGLLRLDDSPIIGGESRELRALHPGARSGPVLVLPEGWEPCWTSSESPGGAPPPVPGEDEVARLAAEVRGKGWIVFSAVADRGDWDLFLCRPDGSDRRPIAATPDHNEAGGRFSPDGKKLLYYRMPKDVPVDNNTYGAQELVIAEADGSRPAVLGDAFPWASWGPGDGRIACLVPGGIEIVDIETRQAVRRIPRKGIVQQLSWAPDGKGFLGTANGLGPYWNIGRLDAETGEIVALSEVERYNCTPDWFPDSRRAIYSRGIVPEKGGRAELWMASADGRERRAIYSEENRHIYGGCVSPDSRHVIFTRSEGDLGGTERKEIALALIRLADAPIAVGADPAWLAARADSRRGPRLDLGMGWEPDWTFSEEPAGAPPAGARGPSSGKER